MLDIPMATILDLLKGEHGSGMAQTIFLFLIWINSRGLKREVKSMHDELKNLEIGHEVRIGSLEKRVDTIERKD